MPEHSCAYPIPFSPTKECQFCRKVGVELVRVYFLVDGYRYGEEHRQVCAGNECEAAAKVELTLLYGEPDTAPFNPKYLASILGRSEIGLVYQPHTSTAVSEETALREWKALCR